jgi:hypothetical protein
MPLAARIVACPVPTASWPRFLPVRGRRTRALYFTHQAGLPRRAAGACVIQSRRAGRPAPMCPLPTAVHLLLALRLAARPAAWAPGTSHQLASALVGRRRRPAVSGTGVSKWISTTKDDTSPWPTSTYNDFLLFNILCTAFHFWTGLHTVIKARFVAPYLLAQLATSAVLACCRCWWHTAFWCWFFFHLRTLKCSKQLHKNLRSIIIYRVLMHIIPLEKNTYIFLHGATWIYFFIKVIGLNTIYYLRSRIFVANSFIFKLKRDK